jgi:hypothetical protein
MLTKHWNISSTGSTIISVTKSIGDYNAIFSPTALIINVGGSADIYFKMLSENDTVDESLSDGILLVHGKEYQFDILKDPIYSINITSSGTPSVTLSAYRYIKTREINYNGIPTNGI